MTVVNESSGTEETQEVGSAFRGYAFYSSMNQMQEYRVAKMMLVAEWLLLLILIGNFMKVFRNRPNLPQTPIFHQPSSAGQ
jgi:hypothetical protein